jgi:two-component system, OmpR family, sensor histidine kinase MprB
VSVLPPFSPLGPDGRWHYRRSLASRVTVLTTIAAGATVLLVAAGAYLTVRMQLQATLDDSLVQRAENASLDLCNPAMDLPPEYLGAANTWVVCFTGPSFVARAEEQLPSITLGTPEVDVVRGEDGRSIRTVASDDGDTLWRVVAVNRGDDRTMVLAQSLESQQAVLHKLGIVMFLFGLAGVIASGMAGWAVARNGLRPVRRLTASVEEIARTEDLRPLPVEGDDEIARLAGAFNQMLAALAASRDRQRQLVADAGHELRTPLTSLRTNLELLMASEQASHRPDAPRLSDQDRAELQADLRAQVDELANLIGDVVELARDDPPEVAAEPLDLADVVERALDRARRRGVAENVTFDVDLASCEVTGDANALERAALNLLDNAAKWSPPGGRVRVTLRAGVAPERPGTAVLEVADAGPGIADEELDLVFERFYRSLDARTMSGSGLGLSIVAQVAERHHGGVSAGRAPEGGALLRFWIPRS